MFDGSLLLRRTGAALITVAALATVVSLALGLATAAGWNAAWWHGLTGPLVTGGLVGVALVHLGADEAWRPGAVAVLVGGLVLLVSPAAGPAATTLGSVVGAAGVLAVLQGRHRWPDPLEAATAVAAVYAALSSAGQLASVLEGYPLPPADLAGPTTWLLASGCFAQLARTEEAPPVLDRVVGLGSLAVLAAAMAAAPVVAAAVALVVALLAEAAYGIEGGLRGKLRLHLSQPLLLVAVLVWIRGVASGLIVLGAEIYLHDTFAEVAPGHLLGPILTLLIVLAWVAHRVPATRATWAVMAACAFVLGLGARWTTTALWTLGEAGMPRRYYIVIPELANEGAWIDMGVGAVLLGIGGAAAAGVLLWHHRCEPLNRVYSHRVR